MTGQFEEIGSFYGLSVERNRAPACAAGRDPTALPLGAPVDCRVRRHCLTYRFGATTSACVPNTQHVHLSTMYSVVEEVVNSSQMQTPHSLDACTCHRCADPRFDAQK